MMDPELAASLDDDRSHQWRLPPWAGGTTVLYVCGRCGIVRRADGKNRPCRGDVRVEPRLSSDGGVA